MSKACGREKRMSDKFVYRGVDAFVDGIGTVRECIDCAALIVGGPTHCIRCVKEGAPKWPFWRRVFPSFFHRREVRRIRRARLRAGRKG